MVTVAAAARVAWKRRCPTTVPKKLFIAAPR
jgi:hypothetical protein